MCIRDRPVIGTYDNKWRHAHKTCAKWTTIPEDVPCWVWDYYVLFHDGAVWRFHPDWKKKKVSACQVQEEQRFPPPPANGINNSDGRGTYRLFKFGNYETSQDANAIADAVAESAVAENSVAESAVAENSRPASTPHDEAMFNFLKGSSTDDVQVHSTTTVVPDVEAASQVKSAVAEKTVSDVGRSPEPAGRPPSALADAGADE